MADNGAVRVRPTAAAALGAAVLGLILGIGAAAAPSVSPAARATADGLAVQVVGPDGAVVASTPRGTAPPVVSQTPAPFAYPDDGSIVSAESTLVTASASGADGTATVESDISRLSLFAGEILADAVHASVTSAGTVGDLGDSWVTNLVVLGTSVPVTQPGTSVPLADWGHATVLIESKKTGPPAGPSWRGTVTGLVVHLDADHGGLAAGSEIRVGLADAFARPPEQAPPARPSKPKPKPVPEPRSARSAPGATLPHMPPPAVVAPAPAKPQVKKAKPTRKRTGPLVVSPPQVTPKLTARRYVFPVYGPSGYGDTFGAPRGDVSGGWHHGDDIFAPLGAPLLAVADGTVFSVGWNDVGGWRLWLRDTAGNEFYYAHLSAYTALAVDGAHVKAGQVLGFAGDTGDAEGTPFHLHFEVHPVAMLFLGYDGAVDPTKYLDAWKRLDDIRILPAVPFGTSPAETSNAPPPGAILLQSSDISTASGLDPGSLRRALRTPRALDLDGSGVGQLPTPLPNLDRA